MGKGSLRITLMACFIAVAISFILGLHWQEVTENYSLSHNSIQNLSCFGLNNLSQTYQLNCYSPLLTTFRGFKKHLTCQIETNHQMSNSESENLRLNEFTTIKADYDNFTLDFDEGKKTIIQSRQPGEIQKPPYKIVQNDSYVMQGIRNELFDEKLGSIYEFITLSKKTGKGMMVWHNTEDESQTADSMASEFFQCE